MKCQVIVFQQIFDYFSLSFHSLSSLLIEILETTTNFTYIFFYHSFIFYFWIFTCVFFLSLLATGTNMIHWFFQAKHFRPVFLCALMFNFLFNLNHDKVLQVNGFRFTIFWERSGLSTFRRNVYVTQVDERKWPLFVHFTNAHTRMMQSTVCTKTN